MKEILFIIIGTIIIHNIIKKYNKEIVLIGSIISLYKVLSILLFFNENNNEIQNREEIFGFIFGLDGISISLITLISILEPILIILIKGETTKEKEIKLINYILFIKLFIIILFYSLDLILFFIFFELILIPMFLIITYYGSKYQFFLPRLEAGIRFFMFTMIGSLLMLFSIILFYSLFGSTSNEYIYYKIGSTTISPILLQIIWIFLFFSFLIKIPMFPFHTWLPLAHSDAPTIGSIILAALLLKLASFGIIRYSIYLFNENPIYNIFIPIIFILALLSIYFSSFIPLRGLYDLKKIIAYTSIIHMNFSIFGFFSKEFIGLLGSTFMIFTHAFISSALFLLVGILYKRFSTRSLLYFQGLTYSMPLFSFFFLIFSLANISLPFFSSFLAEFFILVSTFFFNPFLSLLLLLSLIISSSFVIWCSNRILFGSPSSYFSSSLNSKNSSSLKLNIPGFKDLSFSEVLAISPFFFFTIFFAFFPKSLLSLLSLSLLF